MTMDSINNTLVKMIQFIRLKQLATKYSQDKTQNKIVKYWEEKSDMSGAQLAKQVQRGLEEYYKTSSEINAHLTKPPAGYTSDDVLKAVGYPIKNNKTLLQINMAKEHLTSLESQEEELISQIMHGKYYHNLPNTIASDDLPTLGSPSATVYWGNENPSVSTVLLYSIAAACKLPSVSMPGAATFYPYLTSVSSKLLEKVTIPSTYPFASEKGMILVGDYQYGGHRNFEKQSLLAPEDCSSAVGKATGLTTEQLSRFTTKSISDAYSPETNEYGYKEVTKFNGKIPSEDLPKIEPGDIYLNFDKKHTALILTKPEGNEGKINTLQFGRDIEIDTVNKRSGGGQYIYKLCPEGSDIDGPDTYILRPKPENLYASYSLGDIREKVDHSFYQLIKAYEECGLDPLEAIEVLGDCI